MASSLSGVFHTPTLTALSMVGAYAFFIFRKKGNYTPKTAAPSCLACGVSVGSIYNYFDSKAALLNETVGNVWQEIFHRADDTDVFFSQMLSAMLRQDYDPSTVPEIVRRTLY